MGEGVLLGETADVHHQHTCISGAMAKRKGTVTQLDCSS